MLVVEVVVVVLDAGELRVREGAHVNRVMLVVGHGAERKGNGGRGRGDGAATTGCFGCGQRLPVVVGHELVRLRCVQRVRVVVVVFVVVDGRGEHRGQRRQSLHHVVVHRCQGWVHLVATKVHRQTWLAKAATVTNAQTVAARTRILGRGRRDRGLDAIHVRLAVRARACHGVDGQRRHVAVGTTARRRQFGVSSPKFWRRHSRGVEAARGQRVGSTRRRQWTLDAAATCGACTCACTCAGYGCDDALSPGVRHLAAKHALRTSARRPRAVLGQLVLDGARRLGHLF